MSEHELFATASSLNYDQIGVGRHRKTLKFEFQTIQQVPDPIDPDKIKHTVENETLVVSGPAIEQLEAIFARKAYRESKATGFYKITNTEPSCEPGSVKVYDPNGNELDMNKVTRIEISPLVPGEPVTAKIEVLAVVDLIAKEKK